MADTALRSNNESISSAFNYWVWARASETALSFDGHDVSWRRLKELTDSKMDRFRSAGVRPADRVCVLGSNSADWCIAAVAILRLGATIVPINDRLTHAEVRHIVGDSDCAAVCVDRVRLDEIASMIADSGLRADVIPIGSDDPMIPAPNTRGHPERVRWTEGQSTAPAVVAYTSGTTGKPKGAELSHRSVLAGSWHLATVDGSKSARLLLAQPLSYTSGLISSFLTAICNGWALFLEQSFDPERCLRLIETEGITTFRAVPLIWSEIAEASPFASTDLSTLRTAHVGGAPVPEALLRTWHDRGIVLCQGYGLTEACGAVSFCPPDLALEMPSSVGFGGPHCDVEIRREDGSTANLGEIGEIVVRGPNVMDGYVGNPAETSRTIRSGWLHTGDLGFRDTLGALRIVGRSKDIVISGGINVFPAEIEAVIQSVPGVRDSIVLGVPHPRFGEVPIAVVVADDSVSEQMIRAACEDQLARHKVPNSIIVTGDDLPRTASGKVLSSHVREAYGLIVE